MPVVIRSIDTYCTMCPTLIPKDRQKRGALTCSKECSDKREAAKNQAQAMTECRYCRRPSTPDEREAFNRFRRLERQRPDILYPDHFEVWKAEIDAQAALAGPDATADSSPAAFKRYWKELTRTKESEDGGDPGIEA